MFPNSKILRRVIWPKQASMFVVVGGAAGLIGDLSSFFTAIIAPPILAVLFFCAAGLAAFFCLKKAGEVNMGMEQEVEAVVDCAVCDAMRFSLFAALTFVLLLFIGQGKSATEMMMDKLGLIHDDVAEISGNVQDLSDMSQSHRIISNPKTAQDYFTNAWIYTNIQRDQAKAFAAMESLYDKFGPEKLDAAEMYYTSGRQVKSRDELIAAMEAIAKKHNDATLLIVAGRNAVDPDMIKTLYAQAQARAPDMPFVYWDVQRQQQMMTSAAPDMESQRAMLTAQRDGLEVFLAKMGDQPAGKYFYLPQYQPDYEVLARQTLGSVSGALQSYEKIDRMKAGQ